MTPIAKAHHENCRLIMLSAWAAKRAEPARSFSDCLRGAWAFAKRSAKAAAAFAAKIAGGRLHLRDMLRPIPPSGFSGSALSGQRIAAARLAWGS